MYFDTHAHYYDESFDPDRDETIKDCYAKGISMILNASSNLESAKACVDLADKYPFMYAAVGFHPHDAKEFNEDSPEQLMKLCKNPKVRAIGEIGLDYYYGHSEKDVQKRVFTKQMELARHLNLPVIIHNRDAHFDCMDIVRRFPEVSGEFHCYSGSAEMAKELLDMGWYLGFGGVVTFKNARKVIEVLEMCPTDRILLETDCPYLSPVPNRGKRNDSRNLLYIAEKIAEIKGMDVKELVLTAAENGRSLFGIKG
ncbi:MAG: TatD family hydrolase [Clostridiales bacterium]|nr:TatD family hydrolase [Clostridiales bacterium]